MLRNAQIVLLSLALLVPIVGGCASSGSGPDGPATDTRSQEPANLTDPKRFQDTPGEKRTAVESAIELSEKYARLSDQAATLRQENQRITDENKDLRKQVVNLETKLRQTQKELTEANDLLIEMLAELNNWKSNILGFRGEMRDAARAQLEALLKVLEILGGEAEAGVLAQRHAPTLNPDQSAAAQPRHETSVAGEPNATP